MVRDVGVAGSNPVTPTIDFIGIFPHRTHDFPERVPTRDQRADRRQLKLPVALPHLARQCGQWIALRESYLDPCACSDIIVGDDTSVALYETISHQDFDEARREIGGRVEHAE
jgi:hypothetical protein